jgi:hypothetical protein
MKAYNITDETDWSINSVSTLRAYSLMTHVRFPVHMFLFAKTSRRALRPIQPPTQCVPGLGREADYSLASNARS